MTTKKVSYVKLLKEALQEWDTTKTIDSKGPMIDPILSYDGGGELPTHKDAASILERYYFNEGADDGVAVAEEGPIDNPVDEVPDKNVSKTKKEIEKAVTEQPGEEDKDLEKAAKEKEEEVTEQDKKEEEEEKEEEVTEQDKKEEKEEKEEEVSEEVENAVIEKLIAEMEEEEKDLSEGEMEGAGTKAAGAPSAAEKAVPPDKDKGEGFPVKAAKVKEQDEKEEEKDLDVDKELGKKGEKEEEVEEQGSGAGHVPVKSMGVGKEDKDQDEIQEAFEIFKEQIEEDVDEIDSKDIQV